MKGNALADWLRLREGADHRSRSPRLSKALSTRFAAQDTVTVVDLGAGSGSNLRASVADLPTHQRWILVDHDAVVLATARARLTEWADEARSNGSSLEMVKRDRKLRVEFREADLAREPAPWDAEEPDLVTSSALFDLVSADWIGNFVAALTRTHPPLYTTLIYDGHTEFSPPHPADAAVAAAFAHHHAGDKGFGAGVGGLGADALAAGLVAAGYRVERDQSPWQLGPDDKALVSALAEGCAEAVRETGEVPEGMLSDWLAARMADGVSCTVGHVDLLAFHAG